MFELLDDPMEDEDAGTVPSCDDVRVAAILLGLLIVDCEGKPVGQVELQAELRPRLDVETRSELE